VIAVIITAICPPGSLWGPWRKQYDYFWDCEFLFAQSNMFRVFRLVRLVGWRVLRVLRAAPAPRPANFAARPVGVPAALGFQVLSVSRWWSSLLEEVRNASSEVLVASYVFDHPALTHALVQKLSGRDAFTVVVLVDKEQFDTRACYHQRPRPAELHAAGAAVYLCRGSPPLGSFHMKTVCIDKRSADPVSKD